jgi:hypothetical protein
LACLFCGQWWAASNESSTSLTIRCLDFGNDRTCSLLLQLRHRSAFAALDGLLISSPIKDPTMLPRAREVWDRHVAIAAFVGGRGLLRKPSSPANYT